MLAGFPWLPFDARDRTLVHMLERQAARYGGRPLFTSGGETWTFDATPLISAGMAGVLADRGVKAGDRVAILSPNRPEVMRAILGCGWLGAIAVPIHAAAKTRQVRYALENAGATLLLADPLLVGDLEPGALAALPLRHVLTFEPMTRADLGIAVETCPTPNIAVSPHPARPGDPFAILYTSGTTGPPKGVVCPHAQFHWWGMHTAHFLELTDGDRLATTLPLFHTNALNTFFQALLTGGHQIVLPRFSVRTFWQDMAAAQATVGYLLGAMVPMLLAQLPSPAERAHTLRVVLGPGVPAALHDALFERTGVRLVDGFGSTESNFVIGSTAANRRPGRMGSAAPGIAARVVDGDDTPVPDGTPGELILRADEPFCFAAGYFGMPEATLAAWRNQWVHTGDRVIRHADGTLTFLDRLKDVIRRRGENISAFEVEQVLSTIAGIEAVAVYPVASDLAEDEVMAAIVVSAGAMLDAATVFEHAARELPRHAVPRYLVFAPDLPRTENGKIQKFKLTAAGVSPDAIDRLRV